MAFSQVLTSPSLHFAKISLHLPKLQGETGSMGAASTTTQSDANRRFPVSGEKPAVCGHFRGFKRGRCGLCRPLRSR
jgi:hypothetical protein